jgi:hypothetical protein
MSLLSLSIVTSREVWSSGTVEASCFLLSSIDFCAMRLFALIKRGSVSVGGFFLFLNGCRVLGMAVCGVIVSGLLFGQGDN